jgi:hypothetical protein
MLEAMAKRAADSLGIKGTFRIQLIPECRAKVLPFGKTYVVRLGVPMLAVLTEEEVYQIILSLLDHFTRLGTYRRDTNVWRLSRLGAADIRRETFAFDLFFSHIDATLEWDLEFCVIAYKLLREKQSIRRVQESGDPSAAVSGVCKIAMWRHFCFESADFIPNPFYMEPTLNSHFEQDLCETFRTAIRERHEVWLDMLSRDIPEEGYHEMLFHEYWQCMTPHASAPALNLTWPDPSTAFGQEILTAIEWYDKQEYWRIEPFYKANRKLEYLEPLRITEAYEANPAGYTSPELSPVINAYRDLCKYDKAEAVCDSILETETNPFALAHALYFKGSCMLRRYDVCGIDLIYRAIDLNKNYMKEGFELVEEYCTLCGLADEYETYLRRADIQMSAHAYNHNEAGELTPRDYLVKEEELGDMLPDILSYMEQVSEGCIREIYLVRKVISQDFFTSAFVLNFDYGADKEEAAHRAYTAIFNYLDAYPVDWQFSLFVYDRVTEAAVKRVEGSLVWEKK